MDVEFADGERLRTQYLVGCDGGRSIVRKISRSEFEIIGGTVVYKDAGPIGVMVTEPDATATAEPTLEDLRARLIAACGTDYGVHGLTWISRFTDMTRQAAQYRRGRVLLAGGAAHVHSPIGGQGLSTGVQDAVNLWDLPVIGVVAAPAAVLIRPDGHVAWVGDGTPQGLRESRTTWFGAPIGQDGSEPKRRTCPSGSPTFISRAQG